MTRAITFTQAQVRRAIKAAESAGLRVSSVTVSPDGSITINSGVTRFRNRTMDELPLFASDEELGEAVLGWDRRMEFRGLAELHEPAGMPKMDPMWGGRYVPAVRAYLDSRVGLAAAVPLAPNGVEGTFHVSRKRPMRPRATISG